MSAADLTGKLARLAILDLERDPVEWARWTQDSEYQRLQDSGPNCLYSPGAIRSWLEKESNPNRVVFSIRALPEDRAVGFLELDGFDWPARSCWLGIGIGEPEQRGRGLGTEAMRLAARYAFEQLNLNRINLNVFAFNPRAIRCYEKAGFVREGALRGWLNRYGERWDLIFMGLLRDDWLAQQRIST